MDPCAETLQTHTDMHVFIHKTTGSRAVGDTYTVIIVGGPPDHVESTSTSSPSVDGSQGGNPGMPSRSSLFGSKSTTRAI
jgi:hypothetical protein